jgi:hypothetical protein
MNLIKEPVVMELSGQITATHYPDFPASGRVDHCTMNRTNVTAHEADVRTRNIRQRS